MISSLFCLTPWTITSTFPLPGFTVPATASRYRQLLTQQRLMLLLIMISRTRCFRLITRESFPTFLPGTISGCMLSTGWTWALILRNKRSWEQGYGTSAFTMSITAKTPTFIFTKSRKTVPGDWCSSAWCLLCRRYLISFNLNEKLMIIVKTLISSKYEYREYDFTKFDLCIHIYDVGQSFDSII